MKCITVQGAGSLKNTAQSREDEYLLTELGNLTEHQIIGKEYQYHESCRLNIKTGSASATTSRSFERLVSFVEEYVVDKGHILRVKDIAKLYSDFKLEENEQLEGLLARSVKAPIVISFW